MLVVLRFERLIGEVMTDDDSFVVEAVSDRSLWGSVAVIFGCGLLVVGSPCVCNCLEVPKLSVKILGGGLELKLKSLTSLKSSSVMTSLDLVVWSN